MDESQIKTIDKNSAYYPTAWKTLADAPNEIGYLGDITLLQKRKFTVVGSRTTPAQARKTGATIAEQISRVFVVVTGVADGGDQAAIEGALQGGGNVVCVLAGGFAHIPQSNLPLLREVARKGLLLSPYPFDMPTRSFSYEHRNRLLALLGEGTLILGAAEKSGALITAKYAKEAGKPIFALPYAPGAHAGVGCNRLIKDGAFLTETAADIFARMGVDTSVETTKPVLSDVEQAIVDCLQELSEAHVDELCLKTGIPVFRLRATLSALEVKGVAVALGGNRYAPIQK